MVKKSLALLMLISFLLALSIIPNNSLSTLNWTLFSAIIMGLVVLSFFWRFETRGTGAKEVALIATMAALAAASRVAFAAIMSLQPATFIVMIAGYVFGVDTGFMVGAVAGLVSNFFLGQGPWTPWQMFAWGMAGVSAGFLGGRQKGFNLVSFTLASGLWGYLFGWIMNIWHWVGFVYPLTLKTFVATYAASFPFDTLHAIGNIAFSLIFGGSFYRILVRFKGKMVVDRI